MGTRSSAVEGDSWRVWDDDRSYGETLYNRATGELPEMESSRAVSKVVAKVFREGDTILDVGCGCGHYLRGLDRELPAGFSYQGVDATEHYISLARKAFADRADVRFEVADIFALDLADEAFDIVMCNNVLLHLPEIRRPLSELVRVTRRELFVRLMCGERSFRIQDVHPQPGGAEFAEDGTPIAYHYYNIYSRDYVNHLLERIPGKKRWSIEADTDFDRQRIMDSVKDHPNAVDATTIMGDCQVNGYVLQPWAILHVTKAEE
jgi:ubiquinone/menaquinone biosynthesis C-methylase UbiE